MTRTIDDKRANLEERRGGRPGDEKDAPEARETDTLKPISGDEQEAARVAVEWYGRPVLYWNRRHGSPRTPRHGWIVAQGDALGSATILVCQSPRHDPEMTAQGRYTDYAVDVPILLPGDPVPHHAEHWALLKPAPQYAPKEIDALCESLPRA